MYLNCISRVATIAAASAQMQPGGLQLLASSGGSPRSDPGDRSAPLRTGFVAANLPDGNYTLRLTTEAGRQQQRPATVAC